MPFPCCHPGSLRTDRVILLGTHAVTCVVNKLLHARDYPKHWACLYRDLKEAFDRVKHQQLITVLSEIGMQQTALNWFISHLSDRSQQVKLQSSLSKEKVCSRGVPQGSLGPLHVTLYTRHLPRFLPWSCVCLPMTFSSFTLLATPGSVLRRSHLH